MLLHVIWLLIYYLLYIEKIIHTLTIKKYKYGNSIMIKYKQHNYLNRLNVHLGELLYNYFYEKKVEKQIKINFSEAKVSISVCIN